jgi:hypothetical protein
MPFFSPFGDDANPNNKSGGISSAAIGSLGMGVSDIFAGLGEQWGARLLHLRS